MVDRRLKRSDRIAAARQAAAFVGLDPYARHVGIDLAAAVGAHAPARSVAKRLRAIHRAGHPGRGKEAVSAHSAIEERALDVALGKGHRAFDARVAEPGDERRDRQEELLDGVIDALKQSGVAHAPETQPEALGTRLPLAARFVSEGRRGHEPYASRPSCATSLTSRAASYSASSRVAAALASASRSSPHGTGAPRRHSAR